MARPKQQEWRRLIFTMAGAFPADEPPFTTLTASALLRELELRGGRDLPSARSVRNILKEFANLSDDVRQQYSACYWPESFERGALPWDAAASTLALLKMRGTPNRPTVRLAKWFWRVTLAAPDGLSPEARRRAAWWLEMYEEGLAVDEESGLRTIEGILAGISSEDELGSLAVTLPAAAQATLAKLAAGGVHGTFAEVFAEESYR